MSNPLETIKNWARRDEFRDQNARLEKAGIHIDTYGDRHLSSSLEMYSDQELYYLGKMITDPEQQARFLDPAWGNSYHSRETTRNLSQILDNGSRDHEAQIHILGQINLAVSAFVKKTNHLSFFNYYVHIIGRLILDPGL